MSPRVFILLLLFPILVGCKTEQKEVASPPQPTIRPASEVVFTDVTEKAGIRFRHNSGAKGQKLLPETMGGGGGFIDYDGDGWLDIVLINSVAGQPDAPKEGSPFITLYHNNHDGTFTDESKKVEWQGACYGMGIAVGDYDNDGYDDLYVTGIPQGKLLHNVSDGRGGRKFVEVTAQSGIQDRGWSASAVWLDYDRDGKLDLFVTHYVQWSAEKDRGNLYSVDGVHRSYARPQAFAGEPCRLYHNLGGGRFEDVSQKAGFLSVPQTKALGVVVNDYDSDGSPDIFVANDTEPNQLWHNQGDGTFKEIALESGIAVSGEGAARAGMGIDCADTTGMGHFDLLITNFSGEQLSLYRRDNSGLFLDVAARSGVGTASQTYLGFGAFFFDYDLDGWQDLLVTNGHIQDDIERREAGVSYAEPTLLFHNQGGGNFVEESSRVGGALLLPRVGRAAAYGDFDNDGSPDILIVTNNGAPALLHNENHTGNGWIRLVLEGRRSNRDALGARVKVTVGAAVQTFEVHAGSSYLASQDRRLLVGLGKAQFADKVEIRWSSGKVQSLGKIGRGETKHVIEEGL